jgi:alkylated DNA repair protein alkB family protein 6
MTEHDLETYRIPSLPPSFYYIPNFLSAVESQYILSKAQYTSRLSSKLQFRF